MKKLKKFVLFNIILMIFLLGIFSQLYYSNSQVDEKSLFFHKNFKFFEFTEKDGEFYNITSLSIPLPSSTWNLTDIELNFTEIKMDREVITIEDQEYGSTLLYYISDNYKRLGLAVQVSLSEPTKIFGVYIKGRNISEIKENIRVQIRGYNKVEKRPNGTLYADISLNMSYQAKWYYQNFSSLDLTLPKGNYSLVLNGSAITSWKSKFYWYINEIDPLVPYLHTSEYVNSWGPGIINSTFLYKLVQRKDRLYSPTELNMTIKLNGQQFPVSEYGNLTLKNLNYCPDSENLEIPIIINDIIDLIFNLDYQIHLKNMFITELEQGSVLIKQGNDNIWSISPTINKIYTNYSIKFYYPSNWNSLSILRDNINVTSELLIDKINHCITILHNSIISSHIWEIQATSPQSEFELDIRKNEFEVGKELRFSIEEPVSPGNYTFILYDTLNYEVARQNRSIPPEENLFSYIIPSYSSEGVYRAYVYFYDGLNAGVQIHDFSIIVPIIIEPMALFLIIFTSGLVIAITISITIVIKKYKGKVKAHKEEIYNKFMDILYLNYIMISEKNTSLNVYDQVFTKQKIDPTLISGFLSAIHSFGIELTNTE